MKRYSLLFILLVVFPLFSCRGNRQDVSKRLSSAAGLMLEKPDSALSVIKKIDTLSLRTPYLKAEYSLLLATALDKNRIDTIDIRVIEPAITFFRNRKHPAKYQRALYYQGRIYQNAKDLAASAISLKKAEDLIPLVKDSTYMLLIYEAEAQNYQETYAFEEEYRYAKASLDLVNQTPDLSKYLARTIFKLAIAKANCKQYEEALFILDSLRQSERKDTLLLQQCCRNLGFYSAVFGNGYEQRGFDAFVEAIGLGTAFNTEEYCAYAYLVGFLGSEDDAERMFQYIENSSGETKRKARMWRSVLAAKKNHYEQAYTLLDQTLNYQDSVVRHTLHQSIFAAQAEDYRLKTFQLEQEEKNTRLRHSLIGTALVFFLLILVLSLALLITSNRLKEKEKEAETRKMIAQIKEKYFKEQFVPFGILLEHYERARQRGANEDELLQVITSKFQGLLVGTKGDDWFEKALNEEMDGIMSDFRADYPGLNPIDYRIFCYYAIGFDATLIAVITSSPSVNSVYHRKNRLKKKISESLVPRKERYLRLLQ